MNEKSILDLKRPEIDQNYSSWVCHDTASAIVENYCGVKTEDVFPRSPISGPVNPNEGLQTLETFLSIQDNPLFDDKSKETLFLFRINEYAHSFVIQKFTEPEKEPYYVVYQSWEAQYKLSWWLGFKNSQKAENCSIGNTSDHDKKQRELRQKYGKKKALTKDQVKNFLNDLFNNLIQHGLKSSKIKTIRCLACKPKDVTYNTSHPNNIEHSRKKIEHEDVFLINDAKIRKNIIELKTQLGTEKDLLIQEKSKKQPSFFSRSQQSLQIEIDLKTTKISALESLLSKKFDLLDNDNNRLQQARKFIKNLRREESIEQGFFSQRTKILFSTIYKENDLINTRRYYYPK